MICVYADGISGGGRVCRCLTAVEDYRDPELLSKPSDEDKSETQRLHEIKVWV